VTTILVGRSRLINWTCGADRTKGRSERDSAGLAPLLDYLEAGQPLSEFLEDFPTVTREQAVAALEQAKEALLARARSA
jgi:hypothetical protein